MFYKPHWVPLLADLIMLAVSFFVVLAWFPLATQIPFQKYDIYALVFGAVWVLTNYLTHRYVRVKYMRIGVNLLRLIVAAGMTFFLMWGYMRLLAGEMNYSMNVLLTIWLVMFVFSFIFLLFSHAYRYALNEEEEVERAPERGPQAALKEAQYYDHYQQRNIQETILSYATPKALRWLENSVEVYSSNTFIVCTSELFNLQKLKPFRFDAIVNLKPLNQIRGINKMFGVVNDKLPDDGLFVCCFEPQGMVKKRILETYPPVINGIVYACFFFYRRVLPKLFMTSRLYYDITEGKNRVLSKAEVLGRLCYCGFEIVDEEKRDNLIYVLARRSFRPKTVQRRMYGMFVSLNRVGKDGKTFKVYKFRTMHPYSEFLQAYIYDKYRLQPGGKFNHDIRITTLGHFMRRYWLDELPMLLNLIKGNMKPVGVRPISKQYFSLYSEELQQKRIQHKPGLLPPFYADMPKTLEEIQESEMRYLTRCEQKGTFTTDFIYFWKIFYTIIFRRARSK